jgi:hypothetical protein
MLQSMRPFAVTMQPLLRGQFFDAAMASAGRVFVLIPEDKDFVTQRLAESAQQYRY